MALPNYASARTRFLLDVNGPASVAYSLRRVSSSYRGPAVRVRRSSDSAESDFTTEEILNGTMLSWVGAGDGLLKSWYDQSGNGKTATQSTASSQPQIVSSGSLMLLNGKPSIKWSSTTDKTLICSSAVTTSSSITFSGVFSAQDTAIYNKVYSIGPDPDINPTGYAMCAFTGAAYQDWAKSSCACFGAGWFSNLYPRIVTAANAYINDEFRQNGTFLYLNSADTRMFINGSQPTYAYRINGATTTLTNDTLWIGNSSRLSQQYVGRMQELIFWFSDKSGIRQSISGNVASYYGTTP